MRFEVARTVYSIGRHEPAVKFKDVWNERYQVFRDEAPEPSVSAPARRDPKALKGEHAKELDRGDDFVGVQGFQSLSSRPITRQWTQFVALMRLCPGFARVSTALVMPAKSACACWLGTFLLK